MKWSAAREFYLDDRTPTCIGYIAAFNFPLCHVGDESCDIVAEEVQFVMRNVAFGRMYRRFGRGQAEDEIPASGVNRV